MGLNFHIYGIMGLTKPFSYGIISYSEKTVKREIYYES